MIKEVFEFEEQQLKKKKIPYDRNQLWQEIFFEPDSKLWIRVEAHNKRLEERSGDTSSDEESESMNEDELVAAGTAKAKVDVPGT